MFEFHKDKATYFEYQYLTARDHILPFIAQVKPANEIGTVLEIGCGEAGVLKAFLELGCRCVGIELSQHRTMLALKMHAEAVAKGQISFINRDIYEIDPEIDMPFKFDLIILKDVIEHIPDQERFIPFLRHFLHPGGVVFFGFPPWQMPFGGHQQVCTSRVLGRLPYFHLLPRKAYAGILKLFGESKMTQQGLLEIHDTGISIERFERCVRIAGMQVARRKLWLLNPIYKFKFGRGPYKQWGIIASIPWLRNFLTTAAYYVVA
jgi:SAM-dependent methyltransferase